MTTSLDVEVRVLPAEEWQLVRSARLQSLRTDPAAYLSNVEEEAVWDEEVWRQTFVASRWLIASKWGRTVGLLRSVPDEEHSSARYVESIWVAPLCRRRGVLRLMLHVLAECESFSGFAELKLWVLEDNTEALKVYPRVGFRSTGLRQALGSTYEHQFSRRIGNP